MTNLDRQIRSYIQQVLGSQVHMGDWRGANRLPANLTARYRFILMVLMGQELLLMIDEAPEPEPPAVIKKHTDKVRAKWPEPIVYVRDQVTAYNRKRLIEQRVPFIVPGNQMYLPELGLDLREHFRSPPPPKRQFRPATQAALISVLLDRSQSELTAAGLAPLLGYSTMTLSRAFDELEAVGLAESSAVGRERVLRLRSRRKETWDQAQPWLTDPVKSRHFVAVRSDGLRAGPEALAILTMLGDPRFPVIAISEKQWRSFRRSHPDTERPDREDARYEIEVWKYEPREFDRPGVVEPLSLYLSLRQTRNERVEQALDELMEQIPW